MEKRCPFAQINSNTKQSTKKRTPSGRRQGKENRACSEDAGSNARKSSRSKSSKKAEPPKSKAKITPKQLENKSAGDASRKSSLKKGQSTKKSEAKPPQTSPVQKRFPGSYLEATSDDDAYLEDCEESESVPGKTSNNGTIQTLRQLAVQRGVSLSGNKIQLQKRLQWYNRYNLNSSLIQHVVPVPPLDKAGFTENLRFVACDEVLQSSLKWLSVVEVFSYFQQRSARQGYRNGKLLKQAGFLRNISYAKVDNKVYQVRCYCAATMHKNRMYQLKLEHNGSSITKANCECPAGSGNSAACKHVGALLSALEDFARTGIIQQNTTCTDVLQKWHRPPKNADKSSSYKPIKELFPEPETSENCKINEIPRKEFSDYFLKTTLNAGLHMAIHRSRTVKDMDNYYEEHSYAKPCPEPLKKKKPELRKGPSHVSRAFHEMGIKERILNCFIFKQSEKNNLLSL
nr:uncharacterized protein LOC115270924 isoform X1 [Aedes albopictus]